VNFARDKGKQTELQTDRAYKKIGDVAEGRYDWQIRLSRRRDEKTIPYHIGHTSRTELLR